MKIFIIMCVGTIVALLNNLRCLDQAEIGLCRYHQSPKISADESLFNKIIVKSIFERKKNTRKFFYYSKLIVYILTALQIPWLVLVYFKNLYLIRDIYLCHLVICFLIFELPIFIYGILLKSYERKVEKAKTKR